MAYLDLLINTCTTQRFVAGAIDGYGNPTKTWPNNLVGIACRWSTPSNREIKVGAEVVLVDLILFVGNIDITVQDKVVLDTLTYEVLAVIPRQDSVNGHHKECLLRTVK